MSTTHTIGVAIIGSGGIALANHLPGFAPCPGAQVVALCDSNPAVLQRAGEQSGIRNLFADYHEVLRRDDVHAVVVATPNFLHAPIVIQAARAGKHVLCEKPIAMNLAEALEMVRAADGAGVRHMTAFTYRFVPAMRYMAHLVARGDAGTPYHFRANRFQDWGDRDLGWRQVQKLAGTGELGDMLSHRLDYGHYLMGPITRLCAQTRRFLDTRGGQPSDLEDWVAMLADFKNAATGVFESSKLATGRGEGGRSQDYCEVNGSEGTLVYYLGKPLELQIGRKGEPGLRTVPVPEEFWKVPGSPRDPHDPRGPLVTFRYDQDFEFIEAIKQNRPCRPSLLDGARVQAVSDAAIQSDRERRWVDVPQVEEWVGPASR